MSEQTITAITSVTGTFRSLGDQGATDPRGSGGNTAPISGKSLPADKPDLERVAKALNAEPGSIGRNLRFQVDLDRGTPVIQVLDRETGEIIRQIPPEKVSALLRAESGSGIRLYDELV